MRKPNFSIVLIAKNEANTLPRCLDSLQEFIDRGGEVILGDTGSTDDTVKIATERGVKVYSIDAVINVPPDQVDQINNLVYEGEGILIDKKGPQAKVFDFASARNQATSYATNDFIISLDCDEVYTNFNIDYIIDLVENNVAEIKYTFIYSHKPDGSPELSFTQSKAFDRRHLSWVGVIHEVLLPLRYVEIASVRAPESMILLEHWQEPGKESRSNYIIGLAYDHIVHPSNDRHTHYLAREFMYRQMNQSAINMFDKHIAMGGWEPEISQSIIYRTDCAIRLGVKDAHDKAYLEAFTYDPLRNLALLRIAEYYKNEGKYQAAIPFALMASKMNQSNHFYDDQPGYYNEDPYLILYLCYYWVGMISEGRSALNRCITVAPYNDLHYKNYVFFNNLPTITVVVPHIDGTREEGLNKLIESIKGQEYPAEKIDIKIMPGDETVPEKVNKAVFESKGEMIVFAADDMHFDSLDFIKAVAHHDITGKDLIAFNTGPVNDEGYLCEHFMIKRSAIKYLMNGQLFDERLHHCGVDDLLWKQMAAKGQALRCEYTKTTHNHFSRGGQYDDVYKKGWGNVNSDRSRLKTLLEKITT